MEESMNYDLNIWDEVGYETDYDAEGWSISVYSIPETGASYGSGDFVTNIYLTHDEARVLTLGQSVEDGGDYAPDSDFWLDLESFFTVYKNIPTRVEAFLKGLYMEEKEEEPNGLLSVWQEIR
jgi:hypothetical protein